MLRFLASMMMVAVASLALADDHKSPGDKCPAGQHEVQIEREHCTSGRASGGASVGVGHADASANHERCTKERETVCRDNKDSGIKDK